MVKAAVQSLHLQSVATRVADNIEFLRGMPPSPYGPVEYVIWHDGTGDQVRYWSVDTTDGSHVELDTFDTPNTARQSVATDKTFLFVPSADNYKVIQHCWDGSQFVPLYQEDVDIGANNIPYGLCVIAGHEDGNGKYFVCAGQEFGVTELANVRYQDTAPFDFVGNDQSAVNDNWIEIMDVRSGNAGVWDVGDALVMGPQDPGNLQAYTFNGVTGLLLTAGGNYDPASNGNDSHSWGWCRNSGVITTDYGTGNLGSTTVGIFKVDPSDMQTLDFIGFGVTKSRPAPTPPQDAGNGALAITAVQNGNIIITLEDMDSGLDKIRTYTRDGNGSAPGYPGTIDENSHVDDYELAGPANNEGSGANSYFRINPYTDTIYLLTGNSDIGLVVFTVDASGNITVIAEITGHYASDRFGSSMTFVPTPFTNTVLPEAYIVDDRGHPVFDDQGNFVIPG